jgi:hypothetical protein
MILAFILSSMILTSTAEQGFDMDDDDFIAYVNFHESVRKEYGESFTKGCITGGIGSSFGGFQALCIGCVAGGAGNVAQDVFYPPKK